MNTTNTFKNSLSFPISDYKKLLILGLVCILSSITTIYSAYAEVNGIISTALGIVSIIFGLIIGGYYLSIIKSTIDGSDEIPDFEWKRNFVMGIKYIILEIVYMIIPAIILLIVGFVTGFFDAAEQIVSSIDIDLLTTATNQTAATQAFSNIPDTAIVALSTSLTVIIIVGIVLAIIFGILTLIGTCRLANTGILKAGLNIKAGIEDISAIGWGNFIIWLIILIIILIILSLISGVVGAIPYVGVIISTLIVSPFIVLFMGRAMGLMYASK